MKRFDFSLERVLRLKRQKERLAELEQMKARVAVDEAVAKVESIQMQLLHVAQQVATCVGHVITPSTWSNSYDISVRLNDYLEVARGELQLAEMRFSEATKERISIATEVEAFKSLRSQQWDEYKDENKKAEQIRIDEVISRRRRVAVPQDDKGSE
jgi:flagellar protein FliJ